MLFTKEILKNYADKLNLVLSEDAFDILSNELEYRTRELIQEASKMMFFSRRSKLNVDDINNVFRSRNKTPLFGYSKNEDLVFRETQSSFYIPDEEIDLNELINSPLPKFKPNPVLSTHWLLINGVQPQIPENINDDEVILTKRSKLTDYQVEAQLKTQYQHYLTKELKYCFDNIIGNIDKRTEESLAEANRLLQEEKGIQQLVPYFINYFNEKILPDIRNCQLYVEMYNKLFENQYIKLDSVLHEIIPTYLTVLISEYSTDETRMVVFKGLKFLYDKFKKAYASLGPRIINTLIKHISSKKTTIETQKIAVDAVINISDGNMDTLERNYENFSDEIKEYIKNLSNYCFFIDLISLSNIIVSLPIFV